MAQSISEFENAMKEVYGIGLRNAINNSTVILTEAQRNSRDFVGKKAVWAIHTGRSGATGARAELGILPAADKQRFARPEEDTKTVVHTIKVSAEVIAASRNDTGAFARAMATEMQGAENDLKNNVCRQIYGQGKVQTGTETVVRTGVIAEVAGAPVANVITLDNGTGPAITDSDMRAFYEGMRLDAIDPATGAVDESGMEVVAVDVAARTITVDDDGATADNDYIAVQGSYDNEFLGLRVLINNNDGDQIDGTNTVVVHNVSSATHSTWQSHVVGSATTPISEELFDEAFDEAMISGPGNEPTLMVGGFGQRRALASQLQTQKRYDGRQTTLTAGWKGLNIARGTYVADRYAPDNTVFLIDTSELTWFVLQDFGWDNEDGKVLFKTSNQLAYEGRFVGMFALAVTNRSSHVRVDLQPV